jgi:hypothetical protein
MKNRVIYVDFVKKSITPNPMDILYKKNSIKSFIQKFIKVVSFNYEPSKAKKQTYNYKHTM